MWESTALDFLRLHAAKKKLCTGLQIGIRPPACHECVVWGMQYESVPKLAGLYPGCSLGVRQSLILGVLVELLRLALDVPDAHDDEAPAVHGHPNTPEHGALVEQVDKPGHLAPITPPTRPPPLFLFLTPT